MKNNKKLDIEKHITVLIITLLVFSLGILIGNNLGKQKINEIEKISEEIRMNTLSSELEYQLLIENPCSIKENFLSDDLNELSLKVDYMENQLGPNNKDVLSLKNFYSTVQIRHWLLMQKITEECNLENPIIIYFYSNQGDCNNCKEQGFILSYVKRTTNAQIYSIDINTNNGAVRALKTIYDVKEVPSLIINDKTYEGFMELKEIMEVIEK